MYEAVEKLCHYFQVIHQYSGMSNYPIKFSFGVDETLVVKSWNILERHGAIVGCIRPNNFSDVNGK